MFVDQVREKFIGQDLGANTDSSIIFYFNETFCSPPNKVNNTLLKMPTLPPYKNMIVQFSGKNLFWIIVTDMSTEKSLITIHWIGTVIDGGNSSRISKLTRSCYVCDNHSMNVIDCLLGKNQMISLKSEGQLEELTTDPCFLIFHRFLSLLSCKNVTYEQESPPVKLQKSRVKKGKPPLSSYYVLKLKPTTSRKDYEAKNLWTNRVHLCRGHVREYTEDRPLFGKYTGRFWIPPHVRGDKKQGVIHKDYEIQAT